MARAEALGESQREEFRSDVPRGGGASPEGGTGSSGQHGEEYLVDGEGRYTMRNASYSRHYVEVEVRRRRLRAWPVRSDLRDIPRSEGARDWEGAALRRAGWSEEMVSVRAVNCWICLCLCCRPALPRANNFSVYLTFLHTPRESPRSSIALLSSPYHCTFSSISLFTPLRLGLGRFTRLPTRLPAYHCQYYHHFPSISKKKNDSRSRVPWPYISPTKMSSSEDDKPLVKGWFSLTCTRLPCQEPSDVQFAQLGR